ncbi:methyltransferase family protein [Ulvibacter sp. MAR_2010_11]|uniref:class I SAM-dependent methyltransferase n=1 Tax=Ulvibacter sp. MAR_2010_11 TaxID=1250229 RepID=UPI000C2C2E53|nr:class I SAM-dependent methyltransferase [Ulvibacter sp. MAR_2010_11]PKA83768.1 methyltransferase family protein [Ulvibacter sp. MAR_2010_11]
MVPCILCHSLQTKLLLYRQEVAYYLCNSCGSVYKDPAGFLDREAEKERYLLHENDVNDHDYQYFVNPIVEEVVKHFPEKSTGLDFGAGTGPVIAKLLSEKGYTISLYDPFFHPNTSVLHKTYDFIVCCEVIEHFHNPEKEFELLHKMLEPEGKLFCMTELLPKEKSFATWYYKDDPTHVLFYSEENLKWIQEHFGFKKVEIEGRLVVFSK